MGVDAAARIEVNTDITVMITSGVKKLDPFDLEASRYNTKLLKARAVITLRKKCHIEYKTSLDSPALYIITVYIEARLRIYIYKRPNRSRSSIYRLSSRK